MIGKFLDRSINLSPKPVLSSFHYHYARLIEMLHATEKIEALLADQSILDKHVRATASVNNLEGVGVAEAPRGTLIHHYKVDENGLITWANLVIATKGGITRQGPAQTEYVGRAGYLIQCVEMSLRRLKMERIDLYQLHRIDARTPLEESLGALKRMQEQGKIATRVDADRSAAAMTPITG